MLVEGNVLASSLNRTFLKTKEDISIVCVSRDNKSFCINMASDSVERTDGQLPGSIILTEKPLEGYKAICRIVSESNFSKDMFSSATIGRTRVIANSIEDKLKSFAIIKELRNCI